jgi:putative ABC transport system ATP-binding protein
MRDASAKITRAPEGPSSMIDARGVTKVYETGHGRVEALGGVTLRVARGEIISIMGPSGSGKSTLMAILGCLDRPTTGSYSFDGRDVSYLEDDALAEIRNEKIGFVFQTFNLLSTFDALANVELPLLYRRSRNGAGPLDRRARRAAAEEALAHVGLADRMRHLPAQLSGGQRQRVAIARALVQRPQLLLADEPTGNLDSRVGGEILDFFVTLNEESGMTLVLVTHDADVAARARRTVEIRDGRVLSDQGATHPARPEAP